MPVYWEHYDKRRIKAGVKWHNLLLNDAPESPTKKLISVKILPKDFSGNPIIIWIYGNKVVHVLLSKNYFEFMIESGEIAKNYKKHFKYLWKHVAKAIL